MQKPESQYRSDIDGLRGIAVLFVLAFHGFARLLPGGFIGVDVFFVISGYLIASILYRDLQKNRFSIAGFYQRRIKRIFPALITVLAAACILGWLLLFPFEFRSFGRHLIGGIAFVSNLQLWRETAYFDNDASLKPLLHLWSLGVEEQFYLLFPIILWFAYRKGFATPQFLGLLTVMSFALYVLGSATHPIATFFLPVTRLWELLIGATLAVLEQTRSGSSARPVPAFVSAETPAIRLVKNAGSILGFAMIIVGGFCINPAITFPGFSALLPTLGAVLVIIAGKECAVNRWLVGNKFLVAVGLISYPLYLWHWPLLYFGRILSPNGISNLAIVGVLAASVVLAWLTFVFIEKPIRFGGAFGGRKVLTLCIGMTGLLVVGILAVRGTLSPRLGLNPFCTELEEIEKENFYPFKDNFQRASGFKKDVEIARGAHDQAILFIGDSHMQYYWPRVDMELTKLQAHARPVIFVTAGGSPALPNVNRIEPGYACDKFFDFAMQEAVKTNVSAVVFGCYWEIYFIGGFPDKQKLAPIYRVGDTEKAPVRLGSPAANQVFAEFGQTIATLTRMGKHVYVILPGPESSTWAPYRVARTSAVTSITRQVGVARKDFESFISPVKKPLIDVVARNGGQTIDPLDFFEEDGFFNGKTAEGRFRFRDSDHLRPFYIMDKASFLDPLLHAKGYMQ